MCAVRSNIFGGRDRYSGAGGCTSAHVDLQKIVSLSPCASVLGRRLREIAHGGEFALSAGKWRLTAARVTWSSYPSATGRPLQGSATCAVRYSLRSENWVCSTARPFRRWGCFLVESPSALSSDVCRPSRHTPRQCSDPETDCRQSVDESASMAKGRHGMTLRMGRFPVFFQRVLDNTGLTDG